MHVDRAIHTEAASLDILSIVRANPNATTVRIGVAAHEPQRTDGSESAPPVAGTFLSRPVRDVIRRVAASGRSIREGIRCREYG
jgi:hypothetical protein